MDSTGMVRLHIDISTPGIDERRQLVSDMQDMATVLEFAEAAIHSDGAWDVLFGEMKETMPGITLDSGELRAEISDALHAVMVRVEISDAVHAVMEGFSRAQKIMPQLKKAMQAREGEPADGYDYFTETGTYL